MVRFTMAGKEGAFGYGATYRSSGTAYVVAPDQGVREAWAEYTRGLIRFRSQMGQIWNNVDGDPTQLRSTQTYARMGMTLLGQHWPDMSLNYTHASLLSAFTTGGPPVQRAAIGTLEAALSYTRPTWQTRLACSYILTDNHLSGTKDTTGLLESFTASFRPWNTFTVVPSVGYRTDHDQWSGARVDTPSASINLNYRATQRFFISALGGYSSAHSSDGLVDTEVMNSRALLGWTLPAGWSPAIQPIVAVEAGYTRTAYHAGGWSELQDVSGLMRLIVDEF